jgi:hypothetical protein
MTGSALPLALCLALGSAAPPGDTGASLSCQESNPPDTDCAGTFNRSSNTSGVYRASVVQKPYLLSVGNFNEKPEPEAFTLVVLHP